MPRACFSRDLPFAGSVGRPDLLGEGNKERLALDLHGNLRERVSSLPEGVRLCTGHGAGSLCGVGMWTGMESTLGYERRTQPLLRLGEERFLGQVFLNLAPAPRYYARMKRLNAEGTRIAVIVERATQLSPAEVMALQS